MLLIISAIIIIVTPIVFCKAVDELKIPQMPEPLAPQYWATGTRYLVGDFITDEGLEEMRAKVNSRKSKF